MHRWAVGVGNLDEDAGGGDIGVAMGLDLSCLLEAQGVGFLDLGGARCHGILLGELFGVG